MPLLLVTGRECIDDVVLSTSMKSGIPMRAGKSECTSSFALLNLMYSSMFDQ